MRDEHLHHGPDYLGRVNEIGLNVLVVSCNHRFVYTFKRSFFVALYKVILIANSVGISIHRISTPSGGDLGRRVRENTFAGSTVTGWVPRSQQRVSLPYKGGVESILIFDLFKLGTPSLLEPKTGTGVCCKYEISRQQNPEDYSIRLPTTDFPPTKAWVRPSSPTHVFFRRFG